MPKQNILVQLDTDPQTSVFDSVAAIDAGVQHLLRHGGITAENVRERVHGAIFTRGSDELKHTALFVGGSDVTAGEAVLDAIHNTFFGPMRVSVMLDSNGANTTAAAAVLSASWHLNLAEIEALVLAATGSVGQRVVRLLAMEGAVVRVASRSVERAHAVCDAVSSRVPDARLIPCEVSNESDTAAALQDVQLVICAGAPGVQLVSAATRESSASLKVAIDLNAVPPLGLEGVGMTDRAKDLEGVQCYGAIGVGGTKMKIHKAAIRRLFETNDQVFDAEELYQLARTL
jgi:hypothetical protein